MLALLNMIEMHYINNEDYVYLKTTEDYTTSDVDTFLKQAVEYAKKHNTNRILLDHRGCNFFAEILEIHQITKFLEKYGIGIEFRASVVYDRDVEKYKFADTVAQNWSMGVMKFFDDFKTAKDWLLRS